MVEALYLRIKQDIIAQIQEGKLQPGELIATEKELAQRYGVSQITSKQALNLLAAEGYVERLRGKGTFVKSAKPDEVIEGKQDKQDKLVKNDKQGNQLEDTVALILPSMKTKIDQRLLDGIERYCSEAGLNLLISISRESSTAEQRAIERFRLKGIQGFIIFPVEQESYSDAILRLTLDRFPMVLIDRYLKEIKAYSVSSNNMKGVHTAISRLLQLGHTKIAYISPEITNTATDERAKGYEMAFVDQGLSIDKSLWCMLSLQEIESGLSEQRITQFINEHPEITAVFTVNAYLAEIVKNAIKAAHRQHIIHSTFDDVDYVFAHIRQHEDEVCRSAVSLLLEQLQGKYKPRREFIDVTYVEH